MAEPVTEEEARAIRAQQLFAQQLKTAPATPAPTQAELNAEAEAQDPEAQAAERARALMLQNEGARHPPTAQEDEQRAIVDKYTKAAATGTTPEAPPAEPEAEIVVGDPMGGPVTGSAPLATGPQFAQKPGIADAKAAARSEFNPLDAQKQQAADAYFRAQQQQAPRAVVISKGGMRPDSITSQVTQGPEVKESDRLLHEIEYNGVRSAADEATAGLKRDTDYETIAKANSSAQAKLLPEEQRIQKDQSAALSGVADRMQQALESARTPVVSPAQDLNNMDIGRKLAFVLASAGGGIAGRSSGTNKFLDGYNQMVEARINTQKREAEQNKDYASGQQNLYGVMKQGFQSDDAARAGLRLMYAQALDAKMKEAAAHYNIDLADPKYKGQLASISEQILKWQAELAKIQGQHESRQVTERYAPPQVAVVGGAGDRGGGVGKEEAAIREKIQKMRESGKWGDMESDIDSLNNIVRNSDKGGLIAGYIASHPGQSAANAFIALMSDPTERQKMVDIEHSVKDSISGTGMRSELGRQLGQTLSNPTNAGEVYNRKVQIYKNEVSNGLSSLGPGAFNIYRDMRGDAEAMRHATNTPIVAQGSKELPNALPEQGIPSVRERGAPIVDAYNSRKKSHHKKSN